MAGRSSYIVNTPNQAFGNLSVVHKQATVTSSAGCSNKTLQRGSPIPTAKIIKEK